MQVDRDKWFATIFGYDVFKVSLASEPLSQRATTKAAATLLNYGGSRSAFFYTKIPTQRVDQVQALTAIGFDVVDVSVTFEKKPAASMPDDKRAAFKIRDCLAAEYDAVLDIAASCFKYSRFHLDPYIPNKLANTIKRAWIENYTRKQRGDRLLVSLLDDKPVGFLAVLADIDPGRSIGVIDLIGIDAAYGRQGLGRGLVSFFVNAYAGKCDLLRVGTQAANVPSMRLYESSGFRIAETAYVLHAHMEKGRFRK